MPRLTGRLTIEFDLLEQLQGALAGAATLPDVTVVSSDEGTLTVVIDVDRTS